MPEVQCDVSVERRSRLRAQSTTAPGAHCPKCGWFDPDPEALKFAKAGKLRCLRCGESAEVAYFKADWVRPGGISKVIHAGLYAEATGGKEGP